MRTCEVCGSPATTFVADLEETPPVDGYEQRRVTGKHAFCNEHRRPSRTVMMDGTVRERAHWLPETEAAQA